MASTELVSSPQKSDASFKIHEETEAPGLNSQAKSFTVCFSRAASPPPSQEDFSDCVKGIKRSAHGSPWYESPPTVALLTNQMSNFTHQRSAVPSGTSATLHKVSHPPQIAAAGSTANKYTESPS